mgnify:CR=1 FL=1
MSHETDLTKYDKLECINCDTLCEPDAVRRDGTVIYERHQCQDKYEITPVSRSFEIDFDGEVVQESLR